MELLNDDLLKRYPGADVSIPLATRLQRLWQVHPSLVAIKQMVAEEKLSPKETLGHLIEHWSELGVKSTKIEELKEMGRREKNDFAKFVARTSKIVN